MSGSGVGAVPGGPEAAREIVGCAERTLAAASARIEVQLLSRPPPGWKPLDTGPPGIGLRVLVALLTPISWTIRRRAEYPETGAGFIEPARGRYMIDRGRYADLFADGKLAVGRSGRRVRAAAAQPGEAAPYQVLWLLRLLRSATDAHPEGSETLHGTVCQKLAAQVDVSRAMAATGAGLSSFTAALFEGLEVLPITVWIDGQYIRRIEFQQPLRPSGRQRNGSRQLFSPLLVTLELWEFGVPVDALDWSRLPAFRSRTHT